MAVNATEVLYLTSGLFKAVPSKAILTDLVKFNGNIEGLAASLGTSPYAVNAFPFSNAEKAKTLAENLLGSSVAADAKAAATTALEGVLNANNGNVGIAAVVAIKEILKGGTYADAKAQLENRVEVAKNYVDSNKGNEISTSILDAVTKDAATVTAAIASLSGTTGGNEAGADRVLTNAQDILTGTAGNDNFRAVAGANTGNQDQTTLNSSDIIDGAAGNDTLIVNLVNGGAAANYGGGARIKNIETLKLGTNNNATFDYNVNQGQNEITDVTTIVADQINVGETLTVNNLVRDAADKALPTLSWINDSTAVNGLAGTVNVAYRAAAVSGTADEQAINLTNVRAGTLNINAGIEKAVVASTGSSTNSIRAIDSITGTNTTLKEVVINAEATAALGEGRIISTAAGTRGLEVARTPANDNAQHVSFVNVGSAVTKVDASGSKGNVNVAFTDTATAVANTFIGGEGNDQVVVNGGNDNLSGGKGNDTFIFNQTNTSANGTFFNNSDTLDGGEGTDTIQIDYAGTAALGQVVIQTSEWLNSKGLDALDLRAQNTRVQLDDAFVGRADAGSFEVITNKIVQNDSTTSVADEANSRHQIDLTTVTASRAVKVTGGEGRETVIVTDALNGVQTISGGNGLDALVVQNGATLTGQDLQNVSGINVFNLVKTSANAQSFQIDLTADFLTKAIDANAAAGTSKNTANAFRIVTDTTDTNAATISGVQTLAAGDSVTITVDTTGLTTVDAINIRDLIASNATITVRNTAGTTLLAAANGAVTTNTGIFAGVTGNNYTYTDLTTNPIAGVGTPVASGQASTGGGAVSPVAGNTFTLTAANAVITPTTSANATPAGTMTAGNDTVNAGTLSNGAFVQDSSTTDADVFNAVINTNSTPVLMNVETINATLAGAQLTLTNTTGATQVNVDGANGTVTTANATMPLINLVSGYAGTATITSNAAADVQSIRVSGTNGASITSNSTAATINVAANSTLATLTAGAGTVNVTGAANLGVTTLTTLTALNAGTFTGNLTVGNIAAVTITGGSGNDVFTQTTAAAASVNGGDGTDSFTFGTTGTLTVADTINGGAGSDTITTSGYTATTDLNNITNVGVLNLTGASLAYNYVTVDALLSMGQTLTVSAANATGTSSLLFNGAAETNGAFNITGSANNDTLTGGANNDTIRGGEGQDTIIGGAGADSIILTETTAVTDTVMLGRSDAAGTNLAVASHGIKTITGFGATDILEFDIGGVVVTNNAEKVATLSADGATLTSIENTATAGDVDIVVVLGTHASYTAVQTVLNATAATITDATDGAIVFWTDTSGNTHGYFDTNISAGAGTGTHLVTLTGVATTALGAANLDIVA